MHRTLHPPQPFYDKAYENSNCQLGVFYCCYNIKSKIVSASGHTIELDDTDGAEKINIYDKEGSIITFDTKAKSLYISSTENIEISAKNIKISAEENIVIGAKANIDLAAEGDVTNQAKGNMTIQSDGDTTLNSGGASTLSAKTDAMVNGQNVTVEGKIGADFIGTQTSIQGKMTAVQGASGKIEVM